jgi:imidazolonepropionase-like amidohydrolase
MKTKTMRKLVIALVGALALTATFTHAQDKPRPGKPALLITNARIFDGKSDKLTEPMNVLEGNKFARIAPSIGAPAGATIIDTGGRTRSPGFIDAHAHVLFQISFGKGARTDKFYHAVRGAASAEVYLSRGYTTIRDVGGNTFSLKMAIDEGLAEGPRIYPSGPMISQSSGHADHRLPNEPSQLIGGAQNQFVRYGHELVVDGVPEVLRGVRDTLRRGASQIKIAAGGGTGSEGDPLDVVKFTPEEMRAAVQATSDWNTYVTAHDYNPDGIRRAIEAGVKCIEPGNLVDELTRQLQVDYFVGSRLEPDGTILHFWPRDKVTWIQGLRDTLRIPASRMAAIGDSGGDVEMLQAVRHPVFVGVTLPSGLPGVAHLPGADIATVAQWIIERLRLEA